MKTITIKGWIHARVAEQHDEYEDSGRRSNVFDGIKYQFWQWDQMDGAKMIKPVSIIVEVPDDFSPLPEAIAGLAAERTKIMADAQIKVNEINDRISKLSALTYEAPEVTA